ncbi:MULTISPECIES: YnfA family protein [unclassified Lysinibacillus]|uniref:YnfA family protein n=1 Tax=unclassified Lysinibacillus TaxID=2636778 RepID=UPI0038194AB0
MIYAFILFIVAGIGEIGGIALALYGVVATFQSFPTFGRVYAAYGGVFIVLSVMWGWGIDKQKPDMLDLIGAGICIVGVMVMLWPRS